MVQRTMLVTGGAGFVGSHVIAKLLAEYSDVAVISVDNYFTGSPERHLDDPRVRYIEGSTMDIRKIWSDHGLPSPETIFHLGEYSRIPQSFTDHDITWEFNLRGTKEIVNFAHEHSSRLVYAGSSSKFGNEGKDENLSPYSWVKAKNIEYIRNYSDWFGLDFVVTYFYNVFGPSHIKTGRYATVVGIFEDHYERGIPLPVVSPGTQTRDFTHIDDIVDGILLCAQRGSGDGYLLGTGREWQILEVARLFGAEVEMMPALRGERVRGRADTSKARELGWQPKRDLAEYIDAFTTAARRSRLEPKA